MYRPLMLGAIGMFVATCTAFPVDAQTSSLSDAATQELQRQQERERELRQRQEQTPDVRLPRTPVSPASERFPESESPCFPISRIALTQRRRRGGEAR